ncbi:hypothetical protein [Chryseobacterium sp. StRB126]|uniref:hypothetical protein n=1 Tax=Chryseobacterium sp. StRB126 TaxID=878220 RepID=UPI0005ED67D3|nr:hypothetical protein [Chryseobacterium sp. StRB126]
MQSGAIGNYAIAHKVVYGDPDITRMIPGEAKMKLINFGQIMNAVMNSVYSSKTGQPGKQGILLMKRMFSS